MGELTFAFLVVRTMVQLLLYMCMREGKERRRRGKTKVGMKNGGNVGESKLGNSSLSVQRFLRHRPLSFSFFPRFLFFWHSHAFFEFCGARFFSRMARKRQPLWPIGAVTVAVVLLGIFLFRSPPAAKPQIRESPRNWSLANDTLELRWLSSIPPPELPNAERLVRVQSMLQWARARGGVLRNVRVAATEYGGIGLFATRDLPNRLPYNDVSEEELSDVCAATVPMKTLVVEKTHPLVDFVNKIYAEDGNYALAMFVALCAYQGAECEHYPWLSCVYINPAMRLLCSLFLTLICAGLGFSSIRRASFPASFAMRENTCMFMNQSFSTHDNQMLGSLPSADGAIEFLHDSTLAVIQHTLTGQHLRHARNKLRRRHRRVLNAALKYARRHLPASHPLNAPAGAATAASSSTQQAGRLQQQEQEAPAYRSLAAAEFLRAPGVWWWAWHVVSSRVFLGGKLIPMLDLANYRASDPQTGLVDVRARGRTCVRARWAGGPRRAEAEWGMGMVLGGLDESVTPRFPRCRLSFACAWIGFHFLRCLCCLSCRPSSLRTGRRLCFTRTRRFPRNGRRPRCVPRPPPSAAPRCSTTTTASPRATSTPRNGACVSCRARA